VRKISANGVWKVSVPAGTHTLAAMIDWCFCRPVTFAAHPGAELVFECGTHLAGWRILLAIYYILLKSEDALWLREIR
jgi:hypothetical protein